MKTLKKTLCLVLAVVLAVGTLAISASATDFNDDADIEYNEAVEVLTAIKVIDGKDGNKFDPKGTLTRAEAAQIITKTLLTADTAKKLPASSTVFSDVPATNWAAAAVAYCNGQNIINGFAGKFDPTGELTGVSFAKMLLVAIGVDGEYTGDAWASNVAVASEKIKLADGIADFDYNASLTREQAAQMAYNAIWYSVEGNHTGDWAYDSENGVWVERVTAGEGSIAGEVYNLSWDNTKDAFGRKTKTITDGDKVEVVLADEPVLTYTTATTDGKIAAALGATVTKKVNLTVITDGDAAEAKDVAKTGDNVIGGNGTLVEVYKTAKDTYDVVVINTYVATLAKKDITAAKKATASQDAAAAYITIGEMTYETDAFAADDVVLYTVAYTVDGEGVATGVIQNVVKASSVSGSITASAKGYVRVNGTKYELSANNDELTAGEGALKVSSTTNTYYLDSYGYIIEAAEGEVAEVETDYIYVLNTAASASKSNGDASDLFTESTSSAASAQAQVLDLTTGKISVVNQGVVKSTDGKYYYADKTGAATKTAVTNLAADRTEGKFTPAIYEYATLSDGSIVLVKAADLATVTTKKGDATLGNNDSVSGKYANASTVITLVETTANESGAVVSATVTTYTGIANFPTLTAESALVVANKSGLVSSIVVVKEKETEETVNYAIYAGEGETDTTGTKVAFYVGGERVEYYLDEEFETELTEDTVYDVTVDGGVLTAADAVVATGSSVEVKAVESTFITYGDTNTVVYLADEVAVYDATNSYAKATLEAGDTVNYYTNESGKIDLVIITGAAE
jgi:hypothetical protein